MGEDKALGVRARRKEQEEGGRFRQGLGCWRPSQKEGGNRRGPCVSEQDAALPTKRADAAMAALLGR